MTKIDPNVTQGHPLRHIFSYTKFISCNLDVLMGEYQMENLISEYITLDTPTLRRKEGSTIVNHNLTWLIKNYII